GISAANDGRPASKQANQRSSNKHSPHNDCFLFFSSFSCTYSVRHPPSPTGASRQNGSSILKPEDLPVGGGKALSQYKMQMSIDFKNQYIDERNAFYDANPRIPRKNPEGTAKQLLRLRRYAIRSYPERHGHFWVLNIHVPKPGPKKPARRLRRDVDCGGMAGGRGGG